MDSVKKWQATFFYVKNENPAFDRINLPEFTPEPPTKLNWGHCYKPADAEAEVNLLWKHLRTLVTEERLTAADLLCCYASRRVLPLQARSHKICHMSGRFDPTRTSKLELSPAAVAKRVNWISQAKLAADWQWGMEPYCRDDLPPLVSVSCTRPAAGLRTRLVLIACAVCRNSRGSRSRTGTWR